MLGRELGTDHWVPLDVGQPTEMAAGVLVYLVYAPLWYGNAEYLRERINNLADDSIRVVVLDAGGMSDIDFTGLQALRALATDLQERGKAFAIARSSNLVHHDLKHGALLEQIGPDRLFASVEEAVANVGG
jgi:MFS superfamily sulfate permease-like transporter